MGFTAEQLAKAKAAKSVEELLTYAKEIDFALTENEAKFFFDQWHKEGELSDNELSDVAGGSQCIDGSAYSADPPYQLITTWGNSCPLYAYYECSYSGVDNGRCYQCFWARFDGLTTYCAKRTADNDPYR